MCVCPHVYVHGEEKLWERVENKVREPYKCMDKISFPKMDIS